MLNQVVSKTLTRPVLPLEHVVKTAYDRGLRDNVYTARHPYIAEMVFRQILRQPVERLDKYLRTIRHMNLDYSTDERAFRQMFRGRVIQELFPDRSMIQQLFRIGRDLAGDDPFLLHQMALYEMHATDGDLNEASRLLRVASAKAPRDLTLKHSQAELQLVLADKARSGLEKEERLRESARIARALRNERRDNDTPHSYHTLAKIAIKKLAWRLESIEQDPGAPQPDIVTVIHEAEETLAEGLQRFPCEPYLLDAEAKLADMLKDTPRALSAMRSAFEANPLSGYIAVRLARSLEDSGDSAEARKILTTALEANSTNTRLHYRLSKLLMKHWPSEEQIIQYHLQRSFVQGDSNYDAQLLYARHLFMHGQNNEADEVFRSLRLAKLPFDRRTSTVYKTEERFGGRVQLVEATYCFVQRDGKGDRLFAHRKNIDSAVFRLLGAGSRVTFRLGFSFSGTVAVDMQLPGVDAVGDDNSEA